jgi:hypothetical protein
MIHKPAKFLDEMTFSGSLSGRFAAPCDVVFSA